MNPSAVALPLVLIAVSAVASARVGVSDTDQPARRSALSERPAGLVPEGVRLWAGPDGVPLPMWNDAELVEFLQTAEVVKSKRLGEGVNRPRKVLLERDGVQMNAIFREVDEEIDAVELEGERIRFFRDKYIFECAAYELSRMLGVRSVPPAVYRRIDGRRGSLQVWVEDAMTESKRRNRALKPPDVERWNRQMQTMRVWDNLVHNMDRNTGNILIDRFWQIWMVDHTRSFRRTDDLVRPWEIVMIDKGFWRRLATLDPVVVRERLDPYLTGAEIEDLLERHRRLVRYIHGLIQERGAGAVVYSDRPSASIETAAVPTGRTPRRW